MNTHKYRGLLIQAFSFFAISGIGWIMDVIIFTLLTKLNVPVIFSNIVSATTATTYVYIISTKKIFQNKDGYNLKTKYILYFVYQIIMIVASSVIIYFVSESLRDIITIELILNNVKLVSKILVTPFTMLINFLFMKWLIEKV